VEIELASSLVGPGISLGKTRTACHPPLSGLTLTDLT